MHFVSRLTCAVAVAAVCGFVAVRPAQAQNLVANGGFETGGFTVTDPSGNTFVADVLPRTGIYSAQLGAVSPGGFLTNGASKNFILKQALIEPEDADKQAALQ